MSHLEGQDWDQVVLKKPPINKNKNNEKSAERKREEEEEIKVVPKISLSNSQLIQHGRKNANLTQKQLAQKLSIDSKIIQEYESGKTAPEYKIMCKLENTLKIKLNKKKTQ